MKVKISVPDVKQIAKFWSSLEWKAKKKIYYGAAIVAVVLFFGTWAGCSIQGSNVDTRAGTNTTAPTYSESVTNSNNLVSALMPLVFVLVIFAMVYSVLLLFW